MLRLIGTIASLALFCGAAAAEERSCEMLGTLLSNGNCQDGDIAKIAGIRADDVPDAIQTYCDFGSQILTLPDKGVMTQISGQSQYVVLCKFHERPSAPKN